MSSEDELASALHTGALFQAGDAAKALELLKQIQQTSSRENGTAQCEQNTDLLRRGGAAVAHPAMLAFVVWRRFAARSSCSPSPLTSLALSLAGSRGQKQTRLLLSSPLSSQQ